MISDLAKISDPKEAAAVFEGVSYSADFDPVYLQGVSDTIRSLTLVRANIFFRQGLEALDALGSAALEVGLTRGAGRVLRSLGSTRALSDIGPYSADALSRAALQRVPVISCQDVARCSVIWR